MAHLTGPHRAAPGVGRVAIPGLTVSRSLLGALVISGLQALLPWPLSAQVCTQPVALPAPGTLNFRPYDGTAVAGRTPLILIHGWNGSPADWSTFLGLYDADPQLTQAFKVYLVDYSGVAFTTVTGTQFLGLADQLRDWIQFYENTVHPVSWQGRPVVLLGHSLGGIIARSFMEESSFCDGSRGGDHVSLLVTLATPHHGTPVANDAEDVVGTFTDGLSYFLLTAGADWDDYDGSVVLKPLFPNFLQCINSFSPTADAAFLGACPAAVTSWFSEPGYYDRIIAYGGTASFLQISADPYAGPLDLGSLANDLSGYPNDGFVPIGSALFDDWTIQARRRSDDSCDHIALVRMGRIFNDGSIACQIGGTTDVFAQVKLDLLGALPAPPTLAAALAANPDQGQAPLQTTLTATASGSATGSVNYTFWWDCADPGTSVATVMGICRDVPTPQTNGTCATNEFGTKCNGMSANTQTVVHTYSDAGSFTPKVIVERGNAQPAESRLPMTVTVPSCSGPVAPMLLSPSAGATAVSVTPLLAWSEVAAATAYDVEVCADSACQSSVRSFQVPDDQWSVTPQLVAPATYYWQVRSVDACGPGPWTASSGFTVASPSGGDFALGCSPASLTAPQGGGAGTLCTVSSLGGFSNAVALAAQGLPAGISAASTNWSPQPPPQGSAATAIGINVATGTVPGTYAFKVAGTSGSLTHFFAMSVSVPAGPDFRLACLPASLSVAQGGSVSTTCTLTSLNGFSGTATLALEAVPGSIAVNLSATALTVTANASASSTLTFSVDSGASPAALGIVVSASSGSTTHSAAVALGITAGPDFSVTCNPDTIGTTPGAAAVTACTVTPINGFAGTVAMSCNPVSADTTCAFDPSQVALSGASAGTALTAAASPLTPTGYTYPISVIGSTQGVQRSTVIDLAVNALPDFSLSCDPAGAGAAPGGAATFTCTLKSLNTFSGPVMLNCQGMPAGVSCAFGQNPLTPGAGGSLATGLTLGVGGGVAPGTYPLTVTGVSGAVSHTAALSLSILGSGALWYRAYSGIDQVNAIVNTGDGGSAVGGTEVNGSVVSGFLMKLDLLGNVLWKNVYTAPAGQLNINGVAATADGFVVTGQVHTENPACGADPFLEDLWIAKISLAGSLVWQEDFSVCGDSAVGWAVIATADGGSLVIGDSPLIGAGQTDFWLIKQDAAGNVQWQKAYGGTQSERPLGVRQTADGGYVVVGETRSFGAGNADAWIVKVDAGGGLQWQFAYGGTGDESAYGVEQLSDGGYLVAGLTTGSFGGSTSRWVLRLDALGGLLWQESLRNPNNFGVDSTGQIFGAAKGDGDAILIGGESALLGMGGQIWLTDIDASGAVLWQRLFQAGAAHGLARSAAGDILVGAQAIEDAASNPVVLSLNSLGEILSCPAISDTAAVVAATTGSQTATAGLVTDTPVVPLASAVTAAAAPAVAVTETCNSADSRILLSCTPSGLASAPGGATSATCTIASLGGFAGLVEMACVGLPVGVTCSFGANPLSLAAGATAGVTFTLDVAPTVAVGAQAFEITATSGIYSSSTAATVSVLGPQITSASPAFGSNAGGTSITILGTNLTPGTAVSFGGVAATVVSFVSPTTILATTPPHAPAPVDVTVTNPGGLSATLAGGFTYVCAAPPTAIVSGTTTICPGGSATLQVSLQGEAPYDLEWSDGLVQSGISSSVVTRSVKPSATTTYGLASFSDAACQASAAGSATVTVDTSPTCGSFYTVFPCRVVDTRQSQGVPYGQPALAAGQDRLFLLPGYCGIPATAKAVSLNVTIVQATTAGYLTIHAGGSVVPLASNLNYRAGQVLANNVVAMLGEGGSLSLFAGQAVGVADVLVDVNGYFQ